MPEVKHFIVCVLSVSVWALCCGSFQETDRGRSEKAWRAKMSSVVGKSSPRPGIKQEYTSNAEEAVQNPSIDLNRQASLRTRVDQLQSLNSSVAVSGKAELRVPPQRTSEEKTFLKIARTLHDPLNFQRDSRKTVDKTQLDILAYFRANRNKVHNMSADTSSVLKNAPKEETEEYRGNIDSRSVQDIYPGMLAADTAEKLMQTSFVNKSIINSFVRLGGNRFTNSRLSGQHGNISQFMRHVTLLRESLDKFVGHKRVLRSSETIAPDMEAEQNATESEFVDEDMPVVDNLNDNTETPTTGGKIDIVGGASSDDKVPTKASDVRVSSWVNITRAEQGGDGISGNNYVSVSDTLATVSSENNYGNVLLENITERTVSSGPGEIIHPDTQSSDYVTQGIISASSVSSLNISSQFSSTTDSASTVSPIFSSHEDDITSTTFLRTTISSTTTISNPTESSEMTFTNTASEENESFSGLPTSSHSDKELHSKIHKPDTDEFIVTTPAIVDLVSLETKSTESTQLEKTSNTEAIHNGEATDGINVINQITTNRLEITNTETTNSPEVTSRETADSPEGTNSTAPAHSPRTTDSLVDLMTSIKPETSSIHPHNRQTAPLGESADSITDNSANMDGFTTHINNADISQQPIDVSLDAQDVATGYLNVATQTSSYDTVNTNVLSTESLSSDSQNHSDGYNDNITTTTLALTPDSSPKTADNGYRETPTRRLMTSQTSDANFMGTNSVSTASQMSDSQTSKHPYSSTNGTDVVKFPDSQVTHPYHGDNMDTSSSTSHDQKIDNHFIYTVASSDLNNSTSGLVQTPGPGLKHTLTTTHQWDIHTINSSIASKNRAVNPTLQAGVARLDWEAAKRTWVYAWEIHIYVFGGLFGLFGLYTLFSLVRCWWIRCLLPSGYLIWLHILLMVVCFTRSFYLLYDGYGSNGSFHDSLNHFLYSVTFPCLTAAFSSLFYWFLQKTQVRLMPPFLQRLQVLGVVIAVHFTISLATDVLVGLYPGMHIMLFVCHTYYITWSLFLFLGYTCVFRKLHLHAVKHQKDESYSPAMAASNSAEKSSRLTVTTAVKVMLGVAICGLVVTGLEIYAIVEVYKLFTPGLPGSWTWWSCQTALRIFEVCMCLLLIYVISLPRRYRRSGASCSCGILCAPCSEIFCCCRHSINRPKNESFFKHFHKTPAMNSFHKRYKESFTENSSKELLENQLTDDHHVQPIFGSRPNSLLIIEDGYVRFQTEYDINKIVDSCNDLSQRPVEGHSMRTFLGTDGVLNTGYTLNPGEVLNAGYTLNPEEDSQTKNNSDTQACLTNKSRNSSAANSDYFRVPSSVSLADSIENELEKAFRSFKMDTSADDEETNKPDEMTVVSEVDNVESTDPMSVVSLPKSTITVNNPPQKLVQHDLDNEQVKQSKSQYQSLTSQHQMLTLPTSIELTESKRTAKVDGSLSDPNTQIKPWDPNTQIKPREETSSSGLTDSPDTSYLHHLLVVSKRQHQADSSDDSDYDSECNFPILTRRPSEGQGCQAAVLTSLMKSWESESGENIDV